MWHTKALTEVSRPVSLDFVFSCPGITSAFGFKTLAAARVVVKMIIFRADLVRALTCALHVVEELATWTALNDAATLAVLLVPEKAISAFNLAVFASTGIFIKVHRGGWIQGGSIVQTPVGLFLKALASTVLSVPEGIALTGDQACFWMRHALAFAVI